MPAAAVGALDVAFVRRAAGQFPGERLAFGVGTGTELAQLRPYQVGDDVRQLDPAASARTGEPHVREHVPERTLTTWVALDVSASMAFGTADRLKADVAEGVVSVLARLAVRRAGRIALLSFGASTTRMLPPRGGRGALARVARVLEEGVAVDGTPQPNALHDALRHLRRLARQPGLIAIVSDFREESDWPRAVGILAARHRVLAVELVDPRERALPDAGLLVVVDPETGQQVEADTSSPELRRAFATAERERRERVATALRRAGARHVPLSTDGDWLHALGEGLR
jgi:uncharacterized protein (DUF58 family)